MLEVVPRPTGREPSRRRLLSRVRGHGHHPGSNVVDAAIGPLRTRAGADRIRTARVLGDRLAD